jgi:hypothetical protein
MQIIDRDMHQWRRSCFSEILWKYLRGLCNRPFTAFQRLGDASELWEKAIQKGFDSWLEREEIKLLGILYQRRHLLAHNKGIVDSKYIQKSGDNTYKERQRIIVSGKDVENLVTSLEKLATGIEEECGNT